MQLMIWFQINVRLTVTNLEIKTTMTN